MASKGRTDARGPGARRLLHRLSAAGSNPFLGVVLRTRLPQELGGRTHWNCPHLVKGHIEGPGTLSLEERGHGLSRDQAGHMGAHYAPFMPGMHHLRALYAPS